MFERFTERARQVVVLAQEEARSLKHNYIGTEHLLLGLLREREGLAASVLERFEISVERARGQVVRRVGRGEEVTSGRIPFTPRSKKVLELALAEALSLDHNYIGTEHLLLGLVSEGEGVAVRILIDDFGTDPQTIRNEVARMLSGPGGRRASGASPGVVRIRGRPRTVLDWERATMLWRPEGLELRVPLDLSEGALAMFAADEVWTQEPLAGVRHEIWRGWVAITSPTLLEQLDASELRRRLDHAARRAGNVRGQQQGRVEDFLRRLREQPADQS